MTTIGQRISKIIETSCITKTAFANALNITPAYVSKMINKDFVPSDRLIEDICTKFNISEKWLLDGEGDMLVPSPENAIDALTSEYSLSSLERIMLSKYLKLSEQQRASFWNFMQDSFYEYLEKNDETTHSDFAASAAPKLSIDERLAIIREQMELEERAAANLSASRRDDLDGESKVG